MTLSNYVTTEVRVFSTSQKQVLLRNVLKLARKKCKHNPPPIEVNAKFHSLKLEQDKALEN